MTDPARNNAEWCDAVCRAHGISTVFGSEFWSAAERTPPYYPDAVTLTRDASADDLLRTVDNSAGCSVKDSFACLDLESHGFTVLFEAHWIVRRPDQTINSPQWTQMRTPDRLRDWECGFGSDGLFPPALLADERIAIFAADDGDRVSAGCIANTTGRAVGLSNVFGDYAAAVATVAQHFRTGPSSGTNAVRTSTPLSSWASPPPDGCGSGCADQRPSSTSPERTA